MASGVKCLEEVSEAFLAIKMKKAYRYIIFGLTDDLSKICVVKAAPREATFEDMQRDLHDAEEKKVGRYALFDCETEKKGFVLVFITWCPASLSVKQKMLISSSKDSIRKILTGVRPEIQANESCELTEEICREKAEKA